MDRHIRVISSLAIQSVSLGYTDLKVYRVDELERAQVGYSVDPEANSLIKDQEGSWQRDWVVIGCETLGGDPIFIATSSQGYPVYTAVHGEGNWEPKQIAISLESFAQAISEVAAIAKGRANPVELDANPISTEERDDFFRRLKERNPDIDLEFWELWLEA